MFMKLTPTVNFKLCLWHRNDAKMGENTGKNLFCEKPFFLFWMSGNGFTRWAILIRFPPSSSTMDKARILAWLWLYLLATSWNIKDINGELGLLNLIMAKATYH